LGGADSLVISNNTVRNITVCNAREGRKQERVKDIEIVNFTNISQLSCSGYSFSGIFVYEANNFILKNSIPLLYSFPCPPLVLPTDNDK
jgi:hypothetical protein